MYLPLTILYLLLHSWDTFRHSIGIIGGSGLDDPEILENKTERAIDTPYGQPSDVIIEGFIRGVPCAILARHGRLHSISPHQVNYRANIWALRSIGCTHVLASTACGSLQEEIHPGDFVVLDNFIDRTNSREQTFYDGCETSPSGVCHMPAEPPFCPRTRQSLLQACGTLGVKARDGGTCITVQGPRFSSRAESNAFRMWGGHVVNMTTVPEVVLAKEACLCYAAIAMATDYDCWRDCGQKVCVADVLETFKKNVETVKLILIEAVTAIASEDWSDTINELTKTVKDSVMLPHSSK